MFTSRDICKDIFIGTFLMIINLIIYYIVKNDCPVLTLFMYGVLGFLLYFFTIRESVRLIRYVNQSIQQRIIAAIFIAVFFVGFNSLFRNMTFENMTEQQWISSTYVDRSDMSFIKKVQFNHELRKHFRVAVHGSIMSGDCNSVEDFLNHLRIATITKGMTHDQMVGTVTTNYVLSLCKRHRRKE